MRNGVKWLQVNKCEYRVEKEENGAGEEVIGDAQRILKGCSGGCAEITQGRLRGCSGGSADPQWLLKGCSDVAQEMLEMLMEYSGVAQEMFPGCLEDSQEGQRTLR